MKNVWITGGGSGIGLALAQRLSTGGHNVTISGRSWEKLRKAAPDITHIACDVTEPQQVIETIDAMPFPDIAILNAGAYEPGATTNTSLECFRNTMEVNYFGVLHCLHALLPIMQKRGGHILVVGSLAGYRGLPNASGYGPSKAAVNSLTESLYAELGPDGPVKLQLVCPGFVKSPLTDKNDFEMPHLITPDEAATAIVKGMSSNNFEIAFPAGFVRQMKLLRLLPYRAFFPLIRRVVR